MSLQRWGQKDSLGKLFIGSSGKIAATDRKTFVLELKEPFVGLDPISMGVICRLIAKMNEALGITSIVVSHDVHELALISHYSYLLSEGRVVAAGTPDELNRSGSGIVRQFMSGIADGPVPFHYPAPDYYGQLLSGEEG